ncbi:MAG: hypothetical protein J0L95_17550 [Candidatus Accumulibacter sp.]|jgi:hypothetical protein|uniref:type II secretion system protein N n=1 Tax=Accumulibacter sp. TaxID=2053492 RepID=UPI001ACC89A9|nr:type II secretion system protein N [Accumulibacter sp.]MBN8439821.1 hypothetical protein [Accumulibacter sp.]
MKHRTFSVIGLALASRLLPALAGGLALCLAAWLAADLFWRVFSPRPVVFLPTAQSDPAASARSIAGRHVMGAPPVVVAASSAEWVLTGLATSAPGYPGFAVLAQGGGAPQGVYEGEELAAGVVLSKILPEAIELSSAGVVRRVGLVAAAPTPATVKVPVSGLSPPEPAIGVSRQAAPPSVSPAISVNGAAGVMPANAPGAMVQSPPAPNQ